MPHCWTNSVTGVLWIDTKVVLTKSIITFPLSGWRLDRMARVGSLLAELYSCRQVGANICKYSIIIHIRKLIQFKNPTVSGAAMARTKQSRRDTSRTVNEHYSFQLQSCLFSRFCSNPIKLGPGSKDCVLPEDKGYKKEGKGWSKLVYAIIIVFWST